MVDKTAEKQKPEVKREVFDFFSACIRGICVPPYIMRLMKPKKNHEISHDDHKKFSQDL